jgi:cytochrome P450
VASMIVAVPAPSSATPPAVRVLDTGSASFVADPHPLYDALRRGGPLVRDAIGWSTIDYATSDAAFHDPALTPGIDHLLAARGIGHLWGEPGRTLTDSEGATHQRLRRAVSPWFSVRRIEDLRFRARSLVDELLVGVAGGGALDVMSDLADVVPARLFCWMVGAPDADAPALARLSKHLLSVFTARPEIVAPVRAAKAELGAYTAALLAEKVHARGDDLTSALLRAVDAGQLDGSDAHFLLEELLSASVDNTANTTALALYTLARHPAAWQRVHDDPELLPVAVEECGRYEPAIRHTIKVATAPTMLGDQAVAAGEFVTVRIAAAHRDPTAYPDPHAFDLGRVKPKPQLAFGAGRHYCLGAALGRMEVTEMVGALVARWASAEVLPGVDMDLNTAGIVRSMPIAAAQAAR